MKVALITGGAGGIGSAISRKFAAEGYAVVITYNQSAEKANALLEQLPGENHACFHGPITDSSALNKLAQAVEGKYGKLNVLVNNAGITTPVAHDDLEGLTDEWIDRIFQTNFRGSFAMIRAFKPLLLRSNVGFQNSDFGDIPHPKSQSLIINISSVAAKTGIGSNVAYCASKAAIDSMTRSLGRALAPNIRVVSVSPGWVLGEYTKKIDPAYLKMQEDLTPMARLAQPEDVANTVFALTNYLTFTTGSVIPVDGGRPLK